MKAEVPSFAPPSILDFEAVDSKPKTPDQGYVSLGVFGQRFSSEKQRLVARRSVKPLRLIPETAVLSLRYSTKQLQCVKRQYPPWLPGLRLPALPEAAGECSFF